MTPSAVSQQLARLERETGLTLVVGGGRRLELTPAGEALAEHGRRIVEELAAANDAVSELTDSVTGTVTLASFVTAIATLVAPALQAVQCIHPAITVRLVPEGSALTRLAARRLRAAVGRGAAGVGDAQRPRPARPRRRCGAADRARGGGVPAVLGLVRAGLGRGDDTRAREPLTPGGPGICGNGPRRHPECANPWHPGDGRVRLAVLLGGER